MKVTLISKPQNAIDTIYGAFRTCYSAKGFSSFEEIPLEKKIEFVSSILETGHESPLEHEKFTFAIEGVSRSMTHQLVRHRIASFSQQSGRYVDAKNMGYVIPPRIERIPEARDKYLALMEFCWKEYEELYQILESKGYKQGQAKEDARFVIPQAMSSNICVSMNLRSLMNFFKERTCTRAQWEIRNVAKQMLELVHQELPDIFPKVERWCDIEGICKESSDMTCGIYPNKKQLVELYNSVNNKIKNK